MEQSGSTPTSLTPSSNQSSQNQTQQQHHANQMSCNKPTFGNMDIEVGQQRQRTDSFSLPNQSSQILQNQLNLKTIVKIEELLPRSQQDNILQFPNSNYNLGCNKSRKNSEHIPQTPAFLPEKSKRPMQNNSQNQKSMQNNQYSEFPFTNQQHNQLGVNLEIDEMNIEEPQQLSLTKNSISMKDFSKAETPEKKKMIQQRMQIEDIGNNNNHNISSFNNRNLIQSPDSNFNTRSFRQNPNQDDKRIRQTASKQNELLKQKELNNNRNDEIIRNKHWIKDNQSSKKSMGKQDQSMQQRGIINPTFNRLEQMEQNSLNRKRHHIIDNFAHASDSDDMDNESTGKSHSINRIFEIQKKRQDSKRSRINQQKELERKNQVAFNAPYSNNINTQIAINHREQEKIEMEDQQKEELKAINNPSTLLQNKQDGQPENKGLFNIPTQNKTEIPQVIKQSGINIVIPEKQNNQNTNGESTPLEKKSDDMFKSMINPPPAPKAQTAPNMGAGLFGNIAPSSAQQPQQEKKVESQIPGGLFQNNKAQTAETNTFKQNQAEIPQKETEQANKPQVQGGLFTQLAPNNQTGQSSGLFIKNEAPQQQTQGEGQNESNLMKQLAPRKQATLFGNLTQEQQQHSVSEMKKDNAPAQGLFANQMTAPKSITDSIQEEQQKVLPPKNNQAINPDNNKSNGGLFNNLNTAPPTISVTQAAPSLIAEPVVEKKTIFGGITPNINIGQKPTSSGLFNQIKQGENNIQGGLFAQQVQKAVTEQKTENASETIKPAVAGGLFNQLPVVSNQQNQLLGGNDNKKPTSLFLEKDDKPQTTIGFLGQKNNENEVKPASSGLFSNIQAPQIPQSQSGGLFGKKDTPSTPKTESNSEQKNVIGGLFANQTDKVTPSILSAPSQTNQKQGGLFQNLASSAPSTNNNSNQSQGLFSGNTGIKLTPDQPKQELSSQPKVNGQGLFGGSLNAPFANVAQAQQNGGDDKPKEAKNLFGQLLNVPTSSGGLFNTQQNNPLLDKKQPNIEFSPLPPKAIEENGQLFTQVNNNSSNGSKPEEKPQTSNLFSLGASANQQNQQPPTENKQQNIFSSQPAKSAGESLFGSSSQSTGLFGKQNQPLIQANSSLDQQPPSQEVKKGLFANIQNSSLTGLGSQPQGLGLFKDPATPASQSLFGHQGSGLFNKIDASSQIIPQNVSQSQ